MFINGDFEKSLSDFRLDVQIKQDLTWTENTGELVKEA